MLPTSDEQIRFLVQIQRLLDEGLFGAGNTITLRPGVVFGFRKFHPLISDLVRGA